MAVLVYYFILHLCVSMHACNSRHLGVFHKETGNEVHLTSKNSEIMAGLEGRNVDEKNMVQMESKLEFLSYEQNMHKDYDLMMSAARNIKGWKNHARSTMESKENINNSKDNSVTEDIGVMDYAQPHRKPPIHNLHP